MKPLVTVIDKQIRLTVLPGQPKFYEFVIEIKDWDDLKRDIDAAIALNKATGDPSAVWSTP